MPIPVMLSSTAGASACVEPAKLAQCRCANAGEGSVNDTRDVAMGLLKFIEDSVNEALSDPSSPQRPSLLDNADAAKRVLKEILLRYDKPKLDQLNSLRVFDQGCFVKIADEHSPDPSKKLRDALGKVLFAKKLFGS